MNSTSARHLIGRKTAMNVKNRVDLDPSRVCGFAMIALVTFLFGLEMSRILSEARVANQIPSHQASQFASNLRQLTGSEKISN